VLADDVAGLSQDSRAAWYGEPVAISGRGFAALSDAMIAALAAAFLASCAWRLAFCSGVSVCCSCWVAVRGAAHCLNSLASSWCLLL